jgi:hypothetical protein
MGDLKLRRVGHYLVTHAQQETMDGALEPGDVLLSRKNWYLSNVGLPGFWPHAILYLGAPEKFEAYFDDPEVHAWLASRHEGRTSLLDLLRARAPRETARFRLGADGHPYRVLEAISEGVVLNTLGHASGDYMVALRPRLSKVAKAQAILAAFAQVGKPYDFDFDFATDHALVCTELVWRCYRPAEGKEGLDLPLRTIMGRATLPANDVARIYAEERGEASARFDFVYFLDAHEGRREAFVSDEEGFASTHSRTKWDVALK